MIVDRDRNIEPISDACYFKHPVIDDVDERLTQVKVLSSEARPPSEISTLPPYGLIFPVSLALN